MPSDLVPVLTKSHFSHLERQLLPGWLFLTLCWSTGDTNPVGWGPCVTAWPVAPGGCRLGVLESLSASLALLRSSWAPSQGSLCASVPSPASVHASCIFWSRLERRIHAVAPVVKRSKNFFGLWNNRINQVFAIYLSALYLLYGIKAVKTKETTCSLSSSN